jgi:hypothetical protein
MPWNATQLLKQLAAMEAAPLLERKTHSTASVLIENCLNGGVHSISVCQMCANSAEQAPIQWYTGFLNGRRS